MMKRKSFTVMFMLTILMVSSSLKAQFLPPNYKEAIDKVAHSIAAISQLYVDTVNTNKLAEDAIRGVLSELDPHSVYINADDNKEEMNELEGKFSGVGIQFNMLTDTLYVVQVIPGGPCEKAGLLAGDRIMKVNGENIAGLKVKNSKIMKLLRGPKGTKVTLSVLRGKRQFDYVVTRGEIPIHSRDACYIIPDTKIGYMRFNRFSMTTYDEFEKGAKKLLEEGMDKLIIDLRFNGGGILDAAQNMAGAFLPKGAKVLTVKNNRPPYFSQDLLVESASLPALKKIPLIILINEFSASASEILTGAIQDWDRGLVIGRRSFGKGLVQRPIPLLDGSVIRLTIARYYTPSGRCIQKPYVKGDSRSYEEDILNRFKHGELLHSDSIAFPDSLKYKTLSKGRTVYGGGGIMPDIFIPLDTTKQNDLEKALLMTASLVRVLPHYMDKERKPLLKKYPNASEFETSYHVPNSLFNEVKKVALENDVKWDDQLFAEAKSKLAFLLKCYIARDLYGEDVFYSMINTLDKEYNEAIKIFSEKS